jgi:REP element-mobilizing transposase RayT
LLSKGYFACTSGKSTGEQVQAYLEGQGEHHGYMARPVPPVWVAEYRMSAGIENRLRVQHAWCLLQFHIVLATQQRRGLFAEREARPVAEGWLTCQGETNFALLKVSFLPDHVHVAVRMHPATAPGSLVVLLLNRAQDVVGEQFAASAVSAGLGRLWQPSAYVGSYGDLASPQVRQYIHNWQAAGEGAR